MTNILNLFNQSSPESILAHNLGVSLQITDKSNIIINSTHGNVVKKFPHMVFDKIVIYGIDVPNTTMQWLLTCSPAAKITIYRDNNSNIDTWSSDVTAALEYDAYLDYGDISPCQQMLFICKQNKVWLDQVGDKELKASEEHVFATANHFRFTRTSENFRNRITNEFGDSKVARAIVERKMEFHGDLAFCQCDKEQMWEVARFMSFSRKCFVLYESAAGKNIYWTYGLSREYVKKKFQPQEIWSHGVMLTFSTPKIAVPVNY